MNYCGNIDDPKYREKVQYLSNILGNELADKLATGKLYPADLQERYIKNE